MTVVIFTGPTISAEAARLYLDATFLPPAAAGDVYRAARARPTAIGIIDGFFDSLPSVFHKEILWAMTSGVHVLGASSMGALRASELDMFGMVGVGRIYDDFRSGKLTDDDEVAVAHLADDSTFMATSEAMVNIRATVAIAQQKAVVSPATASALIGAGKDLFYADRTYPAILASLSSKNGASGEVQAFASWLEAHGPVDQKRADAVELLMAIGELAAGQAQPLEVAWQFSDTGFWQDLKEECDEDLVDGDAGGSADFDLVLDELRFDASRTQVWGAAVSQLLARNLAERDGYSFDRAGLAAVADAFWSDRGVTDKAGVEQWMHEREIDGAAMNRLLFQEAYRRWGERNVRYGLRAAVLAQLQLSSHYPRLLQRAERKRRTLLTHDLSDVDDPIGANDDGLWHWWFERRCGGLRPSDLAAYAESIGFSDENALRRAVVREYHFAVLPSRSRPAMSPSNEARTGLRDTDIRTQPFEEGGDAPDVRSRSPVTLSVAAIGSLVRRMLGRSGAHTSPDGRLTGLSDDDIRRIPGRRA